MTQRQIRFLMRSGQRLDTPFVRIYRAPTADGGTPHLACVVGKTVHRHATVRHRYQRLLREAARVLTAQSRTPHDMVWVAKPEILSVKKLADLQQNLKPYLDEISPS